MISNMYVVRCVYLFLSKVLFLLNKHYSGKNESNMLSPSAEISFFSDNVLIRNLDANDVLNSFVMFDYNSSGDGIKKEVFPYIFIESILFAIIKSVALFAFVNFIFSSEILSQIVLTEESRVIFTMGISFVFILRFFASSVVNIRKRMFVVVFFSKLLNDAGMSKLSNLSVKINNSSDISMFTA